MKTQTKKWLSKFLTFMMLVITVCTDAGIMAKAATGNAITKVAIKNMPEDGVLKLENGSYNFDPQILAKENSKRKTTGLVYWEVNQQTNTTGVQSSRWGIVYPVTAGEFEIRAVAFRSQSALNQWLAARKANGNVEDPAAGEKYVTAYSDWAKITVTSDTEGLGIARTQNRLNSLLKNKDITNIKIQTNAERTFNIGSKTYSGKTLTVDAPNAEVNNRGRFASITIEQIKESTFHEFAYGNRFNVKAPNSRLVVEKGATVRSIVYAPEQKAADTQLNFNVELFGTVLAVNVAPVVVETSAATFVFPVITINKAADARLDGVQISSTSDVKITGESEKEVPVVVEETAAGAKVNAEVPVKAELNASAEVNLNKEAVGSEITIAKAEVEASIAGDAENVTVKVEKEAEGAVIKSETKVEVKAEAAVKVELGAGAEGTTIVAADKDVKVEVDNKTTESVEIKDEAGNVTGTVGGGDTAEVTVAPTVAPTSAPSGGGSSSGGGTTTPSTPAPTDTPSTPAPTDTPSTPTPTDTPAPTEIPAFSGKVSYQVGTQAAATELTAEQLAGTADVELAQGVVGEIKITTDADATKYDVAVEPVTLTIDAGKTLLVKVTVTAKDDTANKVTYTINFKAAEAGTSTEEIPAFSGKVSYQVGTQATATELTAEQLAGTAVVELTKGVVGEIKITTDADTTKYDVVVDPATPTIAAGGTAKVTVTVTANDTKANKVTYTINFNAPKDETPSEPDKVVVTVVKGSVTVTSGAAITVSGSAVDVATEDINVVPTDNNSETATAEITLTTGGAATATAADGTVTVTLNATAKVGEKAATGATFEWKKGAEAITGQTGATCTVTIDLSELTGGKSVTITVTATVPDSASSGSGTT